MQVRCPPICFLNVEKIKKGKKRDNMLRRHHNSQLLPLSTDLFFQKPNFPQRAIAFWSVNICPGQCCGRWGSIKRFQDRSELNFHLLRGLLRPPTNLVTPRPCLLCSHRAALQSGWEWMVKGLSWYSAWYWASKWISLLHQLSGNSSQGPFWVGGHLIFTENERNPLDGKGVSFTNEFGITFSYCFAGGWVNSLRGLHMIVYIWLPILRSDEWILEWMNELMSYRTHTHINKHISRTHYVLVKRQLVGIHPRVFQLFQSIWGETSHSQGSLRSCCCCCANHTGSLTQAIVGRVPGHDYCSWQLFANITRYFDPMEWDIHFTSSNPSLGNICGGSPAAVGCAYGCVQYTGIGVDALTGTAVPSLALILATDILHILSFHCSIEPDFF